MTRILTKYNCLATNLGKMISFMYLDRKEHHEAIGTASLNVRGRGLTA